MILLSWLTIFKNESEANRVLSLFSNYLDNEASNLLLYDENNYPVRISKGARKRNISNRTLRIFRLLVVNSLTSEIIYCFRNKALKREQLT